MTDPATSVTVASVHESVMGTFLQLQVTAPDEAGAAAAEATILAEAARLEAALTRFRPDSDLRRWSRGEATATPELARLLSLATRWHERSDGAFHPATAALTERWQQAAEEGTEPTADQLTALLAPSPLPDPTPSIDLHALAKGFVVDLLAEAALAAHDVERLVVNAGGDLLHRGAGVLRVGVEDPFATYDNRPPARRIAIADRAVATSGAARRWFAVGGRRHSRVLDPRTGRPVDHAASATVVARDAATADVVATIVSVLGPVDGPAFVADLASEGTEVACLVIDGDGTASTSPGWADLEI